MTLPNHQKPSTTEHRSKAWPFIPVWRLGLGHAAHPNPRQDEFGCAISVIRQRPSARPPPVQPRGDDTGRHVGAGLGRRPEISCRISASNLREIATSASWNVTYRPCRTTLAPISITLDRRWRSSPQRGHRPVLGLIGWPSPGGCRQWPRHSAPGPSTH